MAVQTFTELQNKFTLWITDEHHDLVSGPSEDVLFKEEKNKWWNEQHAAEGAIETLQEKLVPALTQMKIYS